jgi:anti-anti-sigma factor
MRFVTPFDGRHNGKAGLVPAHSIEVGPTVAGTTLVRLGGEVDLSCVDEVRQTIGTIPDADVVVDCSELAFIDSSGIAALLQAQGLLAAGGHGLILEGVQPLLARVLSVLGIQDRLLGGAGPD